ncbi:hypothetical protein Tco_0260642 [Tanacetum coccineum]
MEKMEGVFVASCHGKGVAESEEVKLEVVGLNEAWTVPRRRGGAEERLKRSGREMLEEKGLRVSKEKTKYLRCDFNWNENDQNKEAEIRIGEPILETNESFRYLGSVIHKFGRKEDDGDDLTSVWTCGKTLLDMIPDGAFRRNLQVTTIVNKMREKRLRLFGHVKRKPPSALVMRVESITVDGVRRMSRLKLRLSLYVPALLA